MTLMSSEFAVCGRNQKSAPISTDAVQTLGVKLYIHYAFFFTENTLKCAKMA